jgi:signal transduction histidine kinase
VYSLKDIEDALPPELREKFRSDGVMSTRAISAANRFAEWFNVSGIPFFKFYTDHSAKHSFDVFLSGVEFIAPDALAGMSAADVAILLASCFCHDAGMHLTEWQFALLVNEKNTAIRCTLDAVSWPQLWKDFIEEAQRFGTKTLKNIFGDDARIAAPPPDPADFTDRHRMLVGEFLRRNHPRLAHELAVGLDTELGLASLLSDFNADERDIIGLISRSHGAELRRFFPYIQKYYDLRDYNRVHIVFLMALLRIADLSQLQPARAPILKTNVHRIASPVSQKEWRVHASVKNITGAHDDPEAIYIDADPTKVADFLRVKSWILELQSELDTSWAVLGEVYGRQTENRLSELKLSLRRARSSIFESKRPFAYVPEEIRFRVAEAEMLSLLLSPLYGDHPGYAVRELLQNAFDAVQEAVFLSAPHLSDVAPYVRLRIEIGSQGGVLSVEDNGVGMTLKTLRDFFLNAGASFRSSPEWKSRFTDSHGKALIARNGRFGIGALAAFIVGDTISVQTRHYSGSSGAGLQFTAALHDDEVEVTQAVIPVGTKITIPITPRKIAALKSYFNNMSGYFAFPKEVDVSCSWIEHGTLEERQLKEQKEAAFRVETSAFPRVDIHQTQGAVIDFVNGIAVVSYTNTGYGQRSRIVDIPSEISLPGVFGWHSSPITTKNVYLSVTDKDGLAPLNLARTAFTSPDRELSDVVARLAFEQLLDKISSLPNSPGETPKDLGFFLRASGASFVFYRGAICLFDVDALNSAGVRDLACYGQNPQNARELVLRFPEIGFVFGVGKGRFISATDFVGRLRHIRANSDSAYVVADRSLLEAAVQLSSMAQWTRDLLEAALERPSWKHKMVPLPLGRKQPTLEPIVRELNESSGTTMFEFLEASKWRAGFRKNNPTPLSRLWQTTFVNSGGLFIPARGI